MFIGPCDWSVTMELEMWGKKCVGQREMQARGGLMWSPPGSIESFAAEE